MVTDACRLQKMKELAEVQAEDEAMNSGSVRDPAVRKGAIRWLRRETLGNLVLIAILFAVSGRWNWWMGWALCGVYIIWSASVAILILPVNPAMLAERASASILQ